MLQCRTKVISEVCLKCNFTVNEYIEAYERVLGNPLLANNLELEFQQTCNRRARDLDVNSNFSVPEMITLY